MLRRILIRNILLIEHIELVLEDGLNVLTGETGAGKSILLDCLGFVLGRRGRADLVRQGASQGEVEVEFDISKNLKLKEILTDAGHQIEDELIIRRLNTSDGRKKAFLNDRAVSAEFLNEVGSALLEIHGQHDDKGLLDEKTHMLLLDHFAGVELGEMRRAYSNLRQAERELALMEERQKKIKSEAEYIAHASSELARLGAKEGEEIELDQSRRLMQQGEKLSSELAELLQLFGSESFGDVFREGKRRLEALHEKLDGVGAELYDQYLAAYDMIANVEMGLARLAGHLEFDPARLEATEERLFAIRAMARKYGVTPDELPGLAVRFGRESQDITEGEASIIRKQAEIKTLHDTAMLLARKIHEKRVKAGQRLDQEILLELTPLKMEAARFMTSISEANLSADGIDHVQFLAQTNPGAPAGSISKIASGGELSRFLLALKLCLHDPASGVVMIFDEIDRGVGGQTADAVGRRLHRLAEKAQLLVVTHSPQVAAQGHRQFRVEKVQSSDMTTTKVSTLGAEARIQELARMISGDHISDEALKAAEKLLERS